jgi:hypothetical protein
MSPSLNITKLMIKKFSSVAHYMCCSVQYQISKYIKIHINKKMHKHLTYNCKLVHNYNDSLTESIQ